MAGSPGSAGRRGPGSSAGAGAKDTGGFHRTPGQSFCPPPAHTVLASCFRKNRSNTEDLQVTDTQGSGHSGPPGVTTAALATRLKLEKQLMAGHDSAHLSSRLSGRLRQEARWVWRPPSTTAALETPPQNESKGGGGAPGRGALAGGSRLFPVQSKALARFSRCRAEPRRCTLAQAGTEEAAPRSLRGAGVTQGAAATAGSGCVRGGEGRAGKGSAVGLSNLCGRRKETARREGRTRLPVALSGFNLFVF